MNRSLLKRIIDICLSVLIIVLCLPLMLIVSIIIKIDSPGPIIYSSIRIGKNMKAIRVFKFRTMIVDAETKITDLLHMNTYDDNFVKIKSDPRITKVGRYIRRISLDELPQFFNVLLGDMSVVGNRPLPVYEAKKLIAENKKDRFEAEAGITGLWQISKRKDSMSSSERIDLDTYYAKRNSLYLDLKILIKTPISAIQNA